MEENDPLQKFKKDFIIVLSIITTSTILYYGIAFFIFGFYFMSIAFAIFCLTNIYTLYIINSQKLSFDNFIKIGVFPYFAVVLIMVMFLWDCFPIIMVWLAIFPATTLFFNNSRKIIFYSLGILVLLGCSISISSIFSLYTYCDQLLKSMTKPEYNILFYGVLFFSFIFIVSYAYFYTRVQEIEREDGIQHDPEFLIDEEIITDPEEEEIEDIGDVKFDQLYDKIIKEIECQELYKNPNLKLSDVAKEIGTNRSYTSAAINKKGKKFTDIINFYRIEYAKKELLKNTRTIKEIYIEAGFNYYSTFNKVFEELEGVKPSQYQQNGRS